MSVGLCVPVTGELAPGQFAPRTIPTRTNPSWTIPSQKIFQFYLYILRISETIPENNPAGLECKETTLQGKNFTKPPCGVRNIKKLPRRVRNVKKLPRRVRASS